MKERTEERKRERQLGRNREAENRVRQTKREKERGEER